MFRSDPGAVRNLHLIFAFLSLLPTGAILAPSFALGDALHVPAEFATIQEALDAAVDGDEVILAPGVYRGAGNIALDFGAKAVTLRSVDPSDPRVVSQTILDGDGGARLLAFTRGESRAATVAGLVIRNGYTSRLPGGGAILIANSSPTFSDCVIRDSLARPRGGGVSLVDSSPLFLRCRFSENRVEERAAGGALFGWNSAPEIVDCEFNRNVAVSGGALFFASLSSQDGNRPVISRCRFKQNTAVAAGGAMAFGKGDTRIEDCDFIANHVTGSDAWDRTRGGAILAAGSYVVRGCRFVGNQVGAASVPAGSLGGALATQASYFTETQVKAIEDCLFRDNHAHDRGGAISIEDHGDRAGDVVTVVVRNCSIEHNIAGLQGGGVYVNQADQGRATTELRNCVIRANRTSSGEGTAGVGGGVYHEAGDLKSMRVDTELRLVGCTVTANTATDDGGGVAFAAPVSIVGSIVHGNTSARGTADVAPRSVGARSTLRVAFSNVGDLAALESDGGVMGASNIDADPRFESGAHLSPHSPCIDAGDPNFAPQVDETDADGEPRVAIGGTGRVDIGADEYHGDRLPRHDIDLFASHGSIEVGGRQATAVTVADFDGDGAEDIAVSLAGQRCRAHRDRDEVARIRGGDHDQVVLLLRDPAQPYRFRLPVPGRRADGITRFDVGSHVEADQAPSFGSDPVDLESCDLNGNGRPDLVCICAGGGSLQVLLDPDGRRPGTLLAPLMLDAQPHQLVIEDIDGDGHLDVAVALRDHRVDLWLNPNGDGRLVHHGEIAAGATSTDVVSAICFDDRTGDGRPDLIVALHHRDGEPQAVASVRALKNRGMNDANRFRGFAPLAVPPVFLDSPVRSMVDADVLPTYHGNEILVVSEACERSDALRIIGTRDGRRTVHSYDVMGSASCVRAEDIDGDGDIDIVLTHGANGYREDYGSMLTVLPAQPDDTVFHREHTYHLHTAALASDIAFLSAEGNAAGGPECLDVIVSSAFLQDRAPDRREPTFLSLHRNLRDGSEPGFIGDIVVGLDADAEDDDPCGCWASQGGDEHDNICRLSGGRTVLLADIDRDGNVDAATMQIKGSQIALSLGNGDGTFQDPPIFVPMSTDSRVMHMARGDLDGDGRIDLAVAHRGSEHGLEIFLNRYVAGPLSANDFVRKHVPLPEEGLWGQLVTMTDWNADGRDDLVVGAMLFAEPFVDAEFRIFAFETVDAGTDIDFTHVQTVPIRSIPGNFVVADVDGDRYQDVVFALHAHSTEGGPQVLPECFGSDTDFLGGAGILWGNPPRSERPFSETAQEVTDSHLADTRNLAIGDFDIDGRLDLALVSHCNDGCTILRNTDGRNFTFQQHIEVGSWPTGVGAVDFDQDGATDLVVNTLHSSNVLFLLNERLQRGGIGDSFESRRFFGVGAANYWCAVDDLDRDGRPDMVVINLHNDDMSVLLNRIPR